MARPKKDIDYRTLAALCACQCTEIECASVLGIGRATLERALKRDGHGTFAEYFAEHSGKGRASLRRRQYELADKGNATMLIWLGKQWLGQSEKSELDLNVPQAISVNFTGDVDKA